MKLKQGCSIYSDYGLNISAEEYADHGVPIIRTSDVNNSGALDLANTKYVETHVVGAKRLRRGDVLFSRSGTIGRAMVFDADVEATYAAYLVRFRPHPKRLLSKYIGYWAQSAGYWHQIGADTIQSTIGNFNANKFANLSIPEHDLATQRQIADFLDRETARIDLLIEKKQRLVALLGEKVESEIWRSIGRDHHPDRPNAVDHPWSENLPHGWALAKVSHFASVGNGSTPSRENLAFWTDQGVPWLNSGAIHQKRVASSEYYVTEHALKNCHLPIVQPDTVLVAITGQGKTRGTAAICKIQATISQHLAFVRIRKPTEILPDYLLLALRAAYTYLRDQSAGVGSTRAALTCDYLKSFKIPKPPMSEQKKLVEYIETIERLSSICSEQTKQSIDRLKEYRSALITAAVTGQIDVTTYAKSGTPDRRLDTIQEEMGA